MIAGQIQPQDGSYAASTKYYQFSTILEHVIDCFHTIVTDETNPYHPPLAWLTRKQPKPPDEELFLDLHDECSQSSDNYASSSGASDNVQLSSSVRGRLEKFPQQLRQDIVSRTRDGCAPLFLACKNNLTRVVKYLLDVCGADIEQRGRYETLEDHHVHSVTPIWVAAVSGHLDTVRLLIDRGADVNSISDTGSTTLRSVCFLCKHDNGNIVEEDEGDNDFQHDDFNFGGNTAECDESDTYMKIVCLLVDSGADINRSNYIGGTCLINSLQNYRLAKYIISKGVDVNATDNQCKTALHYAIQVNRFAVVKLLLANGADPYLQTKDCDDAFRLSCIRGYEDIFEYLISNYPYDVLKVSDAYKLMGSSILEIHHDLTRVRKYWTKAVDIIEKNSDHISSMTTSSTNGAQQVEKKVGDMRRTKAFRGMIEFRTALRMQSLTIDEFRMQSLVITERILGSNHRETIQRLLYRGTSYMNSLRPDRCLDLWIYALKLRLNHDSIFHFESIFGAQAITKLFLDLISQRQKHHVQFCDVYDVLQLLVDRVDECERHLFWRPRSCLHEDIYELLLNMIVKLLLIMRCVQRQHCEYLLAENLILKIVKLNPRTTNGLTLLHICVNPNMFEGGICRSLQIASEENLSSPAAAALDRSSINQNLVDANNRFSNVFNPASSSELGHNGNLQQQPVVELQLDSNWRPEPEAPVVELIKNLVGAGLEVDQIDNDGLSALQMLCLATSIRVTDKRKIIDLLIKRGAHVDRRALTPEQDERIQQALRECGVRTLDFVTLKCLAARRVSELRLSFNKTLLASNLNDSIAIH